MANQGTGQPGATDVLGGFRPAVRSFELNVKRLRLFQSWSGGADGVVDSQLRGVAVVAGKSRVAMTGAPEVATNRLAFTAAARTDEELRFMWQRSSKLAAAARGQRHPILDAVQAKFDARPPTAAIGYWSGNRELGIKAGWYVECWMAVGAFKELATAAHDGHIRGMTVSIDLSPTVVDQPFAWLSQGVAFGVIGEADGGATHGHVGLVEWQVQAALPTRSPAAAATDSGA